MARYEAMCRAISECHKIDEAKDIRDKAVALEHYYKVARNTEAEWKVAEIRVRAERRIGQFLNEIKGHKQQVQAQKTDWILKARLNFDPGKPDNCHICGRYKSITHAHHIIPLAMQFNRGFAIPDNTFVWLCPNHHAAIHLAIELVVNENTKGWFYEFDEKEIKKLMQLALLASSRP